MFGIKRKKDKNIEEPQKEIENNSNVNIFTSEFVLPREALGTITEKHIKSVLVTKMVKALEENLEIEHTTDKLRQLEIFTTKLEVIKRSE